MCRSIKKSCPSSGQGFFFALIILLILSGCSTTEPGFPKGLFELEISVQEHYASVILDLTGATPSLYNGEESIQLDTPVYTDSSLILPISGFESEIHLFHSSTNSITGFWNNIRKHNNGKSPIRANSISSLPTPKVWTKLTPYDLVFHENGENHYPAILELHQSEDNMLKGTILTETGDYRFLHGKLLDHNAFELSTFDGAHLFHFSGQFEADSLIEGHFFSGNTYSETFSGAKNPHAQLTDANHLTTLTSDSIAFTVHHLNGELRSFNPSDFLNQVSIIQIFGSWCPNCLDESRYYKELKEQHGSNLQIIPVAFEAYKELDRQKQAVVRFQSAVGLDVPYYIGGHYSKSEAGEVFHMLDKVRSFPTSIIMDKSGKVRRIHTGFYGPGTGSHYEEYVAEMNIFISELLAE